MNVVRWNRALFVWCALLVVFTMSGARVAHAQSGGVFLLLPTGARAVGLGEAVSADTSLGLEGTWWNPAALSRLASKEGSFNFSNSLLSNSMLLSMAFPSRVIGTISLSGFLIDYGKQEATDRNTGAVTGEITNQNWLVAATYATPVGKRLGLGVTYKWIALRFNNCSGLCTDLKPSSGSTSAVDVGAQYVVPISFPLTVGASVRNLGPDLQTKDKPQADPLPRVTQVGAHSRLPIASLTQAGASLDVSADVIVVPSLDGASTLNYATGATIGYQEQYFLRAGYKKQDGEQGGPSLGFTFQRGAFGLDFSRRFDALSRAFGEPPTFVALRVKF